jgi:hypothetical protein
MESISVSAISRGIRTLNPRQSGFHGPEISHASGETVLGLRSEYREVARRISSHVLGQRWAL